MIEPQATCQLMNGAHNPSNWKPISLRRLSHYQQGIGGIAAVFVLGGILTMFYMKFRDLLANVTAHFFADFVLNVVLPLVSGA
jgi:hypothetical protein